MCIGIGMDMNTMITVIIRGVEVGMEVGEEETVAEAAVGETVVEPAVGVAIENII
jgi:hypothetical protein